MFNIFKKKTGDNDTQKMGMLQKIAMKKNDEYESGGKK